MARNGDRLTEALERVAEATGARTIAVPADVTDRAAVEAGVARVEEEFGRIDLLVNNAGLMDGAEVPLWQADPSDWWGVVTSHILGGFLLVRAVVPGMVSRGRGRVISLGSGLGTRASDLYTAYSVGKTGLMRLTESLAEGLEGTGVHAFDMAPGVVRTDMSTSMSIHEHRTEWTPPEQVVALAASIAAGELDQWSGRLLHAGSDDLGSLRATTPDHAGRKLRLRPYGEDDPVG
jgi:NAD(P)-dependent dehydrogenase (short-subunit alcohol dehydrogenase family)